MICRTTALLVFLLVAGASLPAVSTARAPAPHDGRYIVVYRGSVGNVGGETEKLERAGGFASDFVYRHAVKGFAAKLLPGQLKKVRGDDDVAFVTPDRRVQAFGTAPLAANEPLPPTGVRRIEAATATTVQHTSNVGVAVIDTGINLTHPDLKAFSGKNCVRTGFSAVDDNGHGSHVAGSIAAKNNGSGVVGVTPDTTLYAVKVLNRNGSGTTSQVICGIDWVAANAAAKNIKVANMSLGGGGSPLAGKTCATTTDAERKAICKATDAGVTVVAAAGNSRWDFDYPSQPDVPAAYPEVLTVTAVSDSDGRPGAQGRPPSCRPGELDDRYASFSNYALTAEGKGHTIAAPGVCIRSTWKGGGYSTTSGTSVAAPHVAGSVALCISSGQCTDRNGDGKLAPEAIAKLRADAALHSPGYGFVGDPSSPVGARYFGRLTWAGGY